MKAVLLSLLPAVSLVFGSATCEAEAPVWPTVQEVDLSVGIDWAAEKLFVDLPIRDTSGAIRYRFICRGGSDSYLDPLDEKLGINYVGPLMCVLNEGNREAESSLLAEENVAPWFTRGQYSGGDLLGECGAYPEYGRLRHFRLRGFELTLEVKDEEIVAGRPRYSVFEVRVRNDATATTPSAQKVKVPNPWAAAGGCRRPQ